MIYVFDTSSFNELSPLIPDVFPTFWAKFAEALEDGEITSTREVMREMANGPQHHVVDWCNQNKAMFATPDARETAFVARILAVPHFGGIIGEKQRLRGTPVADPFLIARASVLKATVVSEESVKPNKPNIPAVCGHFGVPCMKLSDFFRAKGWSF